jgi:hypothetical protein
MNVKFDFFSFLFFFSMNGRHGVLFIGTIGTDIGTVLFVLMLECGVHLSYPPLGKCHVSCTKNNPDLDLIWILYGRGIP